MEFEERRKEVTNMEENTGKQGVVKGGEWMDERTDGCRERGRKVAWSQQGELMWAAEFWDSAPGMLLFLPQTALFFFQQEKLSRRRNSQRWTLLVADDRCSVGGGMKVVSYYPHPPKNTLSFTSQNPTVVYVSERKAKRACSLATYDEYFNLFSSFQSNFINKKCQISELMTSHFCWVTWNLFDPRIHRL